MNSFSAPLYCKRCGGWMVDENAAEQMLRFKKTKKTNEFAVRSRNILSVNFPSNSELLRKEESLFPRQSRRYGFLCAEIRPPRLNKAGNNRGDQSGEEETKDSPALSFSNCLVSLFRSCVTVWLISVLGLYYYGQAARVIEKTHPTSFSLHDRHTLQPTTHAFNIIGISM